MSTTNNALLNNVNQTIEEFFSTNAETEEVYAIYVNKTHIHEDASIIRHAFKDLPGVKQIEVNEHEGCIEITCVRNEEILSQVLQSHGYTVVQESEENVAH